VAVGIYSLVRPAPANLNFQIQTVGVKFRVLLYDPPRPAMVWSSLRFVWFPTENVSGRIRCARVGKGIDVLDVLILS